MTTRPALGLAVFLLAVLVVFSLLGSLGWAQESPPPDPHTVALDYACPVDPVTERYEDNCLLQYLAETSQSYRLPAYFMQAVPYLALFVVFGIGHQLGILARLA